MSRNLFRRKVLPTIGALGAIVLLLGATACSGKSDDSASKTVTLWVASPTEAFTQALVTKYNATHENKVELTAIPDDGFLQKVGSAAGAKSLPDILVSDVVYMPNYTSQHILLDITDRINALPYANALAPSHIANGTWQNKKYGVPHKLASSVLFYNKDLFTKAGLDPQKPPTNFDEMLADARAIHAIGPNVYGFDFGGNCGGCTEYTMFPYMWAAGQDMLADQGTKADFDNQASRDVFALYKQLWDQGLVPSNAQTQDGSTWADAFVGGNVGLMAQGSAMIGRLDKESHFNWGVAPLPAPHGSASSTFVGGDSAAITATSKHPDQAWDFLKWTLDEDAQVNVIAKNGDLPDRTDLAGNQYTATDPESR